MTKRKVKASESAEESQVLAGSIENIAHEHLYMSEVSSCWVPQNLNVHNRHQRVASCQDPLDLHTSDKEKFCCRLVTGDETWIHN